MANMAILQEVDKCIRCNGCVIACKRTWKMKALNPGLHKNAYYQRLTIKSQRSMDMGPFVRYSCWHCVAPACVGRCPKNALRKEANGAVSINRDLCDPNVCTRQCNYDCPRGGYPRVGIGSDSYTTAKAEKCTMCFGRAGAGGDLPTRATSGEIGICADRAHEPACVYTCPAKAMAYDQQSVIAARLVNPAEGWVSRAGTGNMYWASKQYLIAAPKADPFVEDHVASLFDTLGSGPLAKAAVVPAVLVGALLAFSARRAKIESETLETSGEVR